MGNGTLIGLGYSETVPPLEVQEDLYVVYCPCHTYTRELVRLTSPATTHSSSFHITSSLSYILEGTTGRFMPGRCENRP